MKSGRLLVLFWILDSGFWILLLFTLCTSSAWATPPTFARLSFWVPPQRMAEFEAAYREKVVPILKQHDLVESSERGRATPDIIFSRLFEVKTPSEVAERQKALQEDSKWRQALRDLGRDFGAGADSLTRHSFRLYSAPAGRGRAVPAGPGQVVPAGRGRRHWRTYDVTDGLASGVVLAILQDRDGLLWFGTSDGVSRFDGHIWTTFTVKDGLAGHTVRSICQDRNGHLWFAFEGDGGLSRYDGKVWTTFTTRDGLAQPAARSIIQDRNGYIWVGGTKGASRYDGQKWTVITTKDGLASNNVWSIFQDREGNLWFGTHGGGVSRYDGRVFTNLNPGGGFASYPVRSILQDRKGIFWFGTYGGGVSRYDPSARPGQAWTTFTTRDGLAHDHVNSILQDQDGDLWFFTEGGVSCYNGRVFTPFTAEGGLVHHRVWAALQDREGHLWFGTFGEGVTRYDGQTWTTFSVQEGLAGRVIRCVMQDRKGDIWFAVEDQGASRYDGKTLTTFTSRDGLPKGMGGRWIVEDREGALWLAGGDGGISRYDGRTFTTFTAEDGLSGNDVWSIFQDREGYLWFGCIYGGGLSRYDGRTFTAFSVEDGLAGNSVFAIFQDREGYLWFGTGEGVSRYDGKNFITFTERDGLGSRVVWSVLQDLEGNLWFGSKGGGISRYDPLRQAQGSGQAWTTLTTQDGLASNWVWPMLQGGEGHFWFGTDGSGVSHYSPPGVPGEGGQAWATFTTRDGLAGNRIVSLFQDREGNIWFGTTDGVTRYRPPKVWPPPVFIDGVVADRRYERVSELAIPSLVKLVTFEFRAISFKTRPEQMVYRYRLKGYDRDWKTTHNRRVEYHDLPRGTYTFEVQAVDRDLVYSERPATVTLRVRLPYERIGWMSALGLAVALVAWQTARVVRRDRRLAATNEDLRREMAERRQAEEEQARLDERLQQLHYLYRIRSALSVARSSDEVIRRAGEILMEALSASTVAGVAIRHGGRVWTFGACEECGMRNVECGMKSNETENPKSEIRNPKSGGVIQVRYARPLAWGERERGFLRLCCGVALSEAQEGMLLDETAGQIGGALEARELEAQVLQSARLVSLGQMAAGVAHELHQPLWAISATVEDVYHRVMDRMGVSQERLKEMMQEALGLVERMTGTIEHLRVFSRDASQEPGAPFSVNEVILSSLSLVQAQLRGHGVALHLELSEGLPSVSGHARQVEQVFLNLLGNARDALDEKETGDRRQETGDRENHIRSTGLGTRPHGSVWGGGIYRREMEWEKGIWVRTRREEEWVVAEVEDNGVGMDEAVRARLFEPFFTTKPADRGTGIGLSICYAIVQNHGGQIEAESEVGKGTTFRVRLPAAREE